MDKYDLEKIMKYLAKEMGDYSNIRAGGNLGTAIQGMLNYNGAVKIAESIDKLRETIGEKLPTPPSQGDNEK